MGLAGCGDCLAGCRTAWQLPASVLTSTIGRLGRDPEARDPASLRITLHLFRPCSCAADELSHSTAQPSGRWSQQQQQQNGERLSQLPDLCCCLAWPAHTGVVGTIIGDGIAQFTSRNSRSRNVPVYDVARATRLCTYAAVIGSPIGHYWFNFLDKVGCLLRGGGLIPPSRKGPHSSRRSSGAPGTTKRRARPAVFSTIV